MRVPHITAAAVIIFLAAVALAGCGSGESGTTAGGGTGASGKDVVTIDEQAAGTSVNLKVGQTLQMVLEGNPTTGYEWTLEPPMGTSLKEGGVKVQPVTSDTNVVGAPSTYTFSFTAEQPGSTDLNFLYKRSWESSADDKTVTVTVAVE